MTYGRIVVKIFFSIFFEHMMDYTVSKIPPRQAMEYIRKNHYSRGCHNGPSPCYGLFDADELIGVLMFATPCSENVRASIYGTDRKNEVIELHRLHIMDSTPKNTESWFIAKCLKMLKNDKPEKSAVVSFADPTEGHAGTIYRASNALYYGRSGRARFYLDRTGRLRHPRQNGVNITVKAAKEKGWEPTWRKGKHRYLFLVSRNKWHRKRLLQDLVVETLPYPA